MSDSVDRALASRLKNVRLCVITDQGLSRGRSLEEVIAAAIRGGAQMIQLRDKELPDGEFYAQAVKLRELTRQASVLFIVDDRVDVALAVSADGIHLGEKDMPADVVRKLIGPEMLLGVSARTPASVHSAQLAGADYLGVGAMFPTETKSNAPYVGPERIAQLRSVVKIPILAIGGITAQNAVQVIRAGADGVAVISAVVGAEDIAEAAAMILKRVRQARGEMG